MTEIEKLAGLDKLRKIVDDYINVVKFIKKYEKQHGKIKVKK